jgi:hypothetical protein
VGITPGPGERVVDRWKVESLTGFAHRVQSALGDHADRPSFLAVDGRSGGGKTTVARRLTEVLPSVTVVHTDDIAWNHSFFDWAELLVDDVLSPLRTGVDVSYRPASWIAHDRAGRIEVPAADLVIIEGVGSSQPRLASELDATIWVQSDFAEAERRGILRDGGDAAAAAFWREWMDAETPFLAGYRPWERATFVVAGTPDMTHDPITEIVVAESRGDHRPA